MRKLILVLIAAFGMQAYAAANFLGLTEGEIDSCEQNFRFCSVSSMLSNDEYTEDMIKLIDAMDKYFLKRSTGNERAYSVQVQAIYRAKEGVWHQTGADRRSDFRVDFRVYDRGDRQDCTIKFGEFEDQFNSKPYWPRLVTLKCSEFVQPR